MMCVGAITQEKGAGECQVKALISSSLCPSVVDMKALFGLLIDIKAIYTTCLKRLKANNYDLNSCLPFLCFALSVDA